MIEIYELLTYDKTTNIHHNALVRDDIMGNVVQSTYSSSTGKCERIYAYYIWWVSTCLKWLNCLKENKTDTF